MKLFSRTLGLGFAKELAIVFVFVAVAAQAQVYTPLYNYGTNTGDPLNPALSARFRRAGTAVYTAPRLSAEHTMEEPPMPSRPAAT